MTVSLTSEQGEGVACTVIPYGLTVDTVDFAGDLLFAILLRINHLSQWRVQKEVLISERWRVCKELTVQSTLECVDYVAQSGLSSNWPARAWCWGGLLSIPLWSPSTGIGFFFPAFWFIHANMSKHQAQSPERKQEREGGGRWGGGGRGELEHLCDTEQQVRVKQMERQRKRSVCFSSQSFNFLPDEPSTAAKGRSR